MCAEEVKDGSGGWRCYVFCFFFQKSKSLFHRFIAFDEILMVCPVCLRRWESGAGAAREARRGGCERGVVVGLFDTVV